LYEQSSADAADNQPISVAIGTLNHAVPYTYSKKFPALWNIILIKRTTVLVAIRNQIWRSMCRFFLFF
jgi:hypothetical protein